MNAKGWRPFWAALLAGLLVLVPLVGGTVLLTLRRWGDRAVLTCTNSGSTPDDGQLSALLEGASPHLLPEPGEGAGMGLPIIRHIVALHGGTLLLQGRAEGAAVSILLPLSAPGKEQLSLHSPVLVPEDGAPNAALIALADVLPPEVYDTRNL